MAVTWWAALLVGFYVKQHRIFLSMLKGAVFAILHHYCPPLVAQRPQCHLSHSESRLVDRPTQLICIWIYIWCQHSNTKDIAGQSAKSRLSYQSMQLKATHAICHCVPTQQASLFSWKMWTFRYYFAHAGGWKKMLGRWNWFKRGSPVKQVLRKHL